MQLSIVNLSKLSIEQRLDAEYYKPKHLAAESRVKAKPCRLTNRLCKLLSGPFGSTVTTSKYVQDSRFRYIRGKDIHDFFVDDSDPVYIAKEPFDELPQFHLKPFDILVTVVGMNFGKAALILPDDGPAIFSCKSSLLRDVTVNPFYLVTFLSSRYGYDLIRRGQRGAAQPGINLLDLRDIPVPVASDQIQKSCEFIVLQARSAFQSSKSFYAQAEQLLLSELGLQGWKPKHTSTYVGSYNQMIRTQRLDAEHFQPKFQAMFDKLGTDVRLVRLGKLVTLTKGIEVGVAAYTDSDVPFWRVSNLTKHGLDDSGLNYISDELYQLLRGDYEPRQGELLLSKDATPGLAFYLEQPIQGITSSGILRLAFVDDIPPHYLELALNSIFVQLQIEQTVGGSVIKHWKPSEVCKTLVPRLSQQEESDIAALVQQSHAARQQAKALLEKARRAVEIAIEENEEHAIAFLEQIEI